jgi:hypothetical protein
MADIYLCDQPSSNAQAARAAYPRGATVAIVVTRRIGYAAGATAEAKLGQDQLPVARALLDSAGTTLPDGALRILGPLKTECEQRQASAVNPGMFSAETPFPLLP